MNRRAWSWRARFGAKAGGFTLIELLVVIAVIALLIGILLPTLGKARKTARMLKEQAACKEMLNGWFVYNASYKDEVIPGYSNWSWAHPHAGRVDMMPPDPADTRKRMEGDVIKSWPWRFVALTNFPIGAMQTNVQTLEAFRARSQAPSSSGATNLYDDNQSFQYAMACHPSFGMNSVFVGGHYLLGAFQNGDGSGAGVSGGTQGKFWISRVDEARKPSKLIVFSTAHQMDVKYSGRSTSGYTGLPTTVTAPAANTQLVPGSAHVYPPVTGYTVRSGYSAPAWAAATEKVDMNDKNASKWGNVDFRHFGKAIIGTVDGHAETIDPTTMRDMQRWSNKAKDKYDAASRG